MGNCFCNHCHTKQAHEIVHDSGGNAVSNEETVTSTEAPQVIHNSLECVTEHKAHWNPQVIHPELEYNTERVLIGDRRSFLIWGFIRMYVEITEQFQFTRIIPEVLKQLIINFLGNYLFHGQNCYLIDEYNGDKIVVKNNINEGVNESVAYEKKSNKVKLVSIKPLKDNIVSSIRVTVHEGVEWVQNLCIGVVSRPVGFMGDEEKQTPFHHCECETSYVYFEEQIMGFKDGQLINARAGNALDLSAGVTLNVNLHNLTLQIPELYGSILDPIDMMRFRQYFVAMSFEYDSASLCERNINVCIQIN